MTSRPLHRAGDDEPRGPWPPPELDPLEAQTDDRLDLPDRVLVAAATLTLAVFALLAAAAFVAAAVAAVR